VDSNFNVGLAVGPDVEYVKFVTRRSPDSCEGSSVVSLKARSVQSMRGSDLSARNTSDGSAFSCRQKGWYVIGADFCHDRRMVPASSIWRLPTAKTITRLRRVRPADDSGARCPRPVLSKLPDLMPANSSKSRSGNHCRPESRACSSMKEPIRQLSHSAMRHPAALLRPESGISARRTTPAT